MEETSTTQEIINEEAQHINSVGLRSSRYTCDTNSCHNLSAEELVLFENDPTDNEQSTVGWRDETMSIYENNTLTANETFNNDGLDGDSDEDTVARREDRIAARGLLAAAEYTLRESGIRRIIGGRLLRRPDEIQLQTSPCRAVQLVNKTFVDGTNRRGRRGIGTPPIRMELCNANAFYNPSDSEGIFNQFYKCVKRRMERFGADLYETFRNNSRGTRRILHDSIEYEESRHGSFNTMVEKLIERLDKGNGCAIFFHESQDQKGEWPYPTNISRGYYPEFDFCVFRNDEVWNGKLVQEPIEEDSSDGREFGGRRWLDLEEYYYFHDSKKKAIYFRESGQSQESNFIAFPIPIKGHFHVLHACTWYNQECRCLSRHFDVNPRKNSAMRSECISSDHIRNILLYNTKWPRWAVYIKVSNEEKFRFVYRTESIREEEIRSNEQNELEGSSSALEIRHKRNREGSSDGEHDSGRPNYKNSRSSQKGDCVQKIIRFLQQTPTWPLEHIFQTKEWLEGPFGTWVASDKTVKRAIEIYSLQNMHYTYIQLVDYYTKLDCNAIWAAPTLQTFEDYYHTLEESIDIIEKLLTYQCEQDEYLSEMTAIEAKKIFVNDLWDILEKRRPKQNTFQIIGEPSAGKNFFIDAILSFYLNTGIILNFNRFSQFPLMEAVNRRVNVWNEPNFEPAALDTIKMLLAGDPMKVNVKYQKEQYLQKTPIIVMSNKPVFPNELAFHDRICTYYWKRAPFLKDCNKKIHPMIWKYLVNTYVLENIDM